MPADVAFVLQLARIDQLFVAPDTNPFSEREVEIVGEAGMDRIHKRVLRSWPRRPHSVQVTLQLPADQITPDASERARAAVQRYCAERMADNRLQRRLAIQRSWRQLIGAGVSIVVALAVIAVLVASPFELLSPFLRGVLIVLALYACSVLSFDAVWSLVFDWVPYVQENAVYGTLVGMRVVVEALPEEGIASEGRVRGRLPTPSAS